MSLKMVHPEHGVTITVEGEVPWHEANGWKRFVPEAKPAEAKVEVVEVVEKVVVTPKRRGRPPNKVK